MASVTRTVDVDVATWSSGIAAGAGSHLPVGAWGSANYRSAIRFDPPPGWAAWTEITKATLSFYISDHSHVGVRSSSIYVRRQNVTAPLWTKSPGTQNCESGFTGANTTQYADIAPTSTDQVTFSSGTTANAKKSVVVTAQVRYYHEQGASKLVFVFDEVGSGDYTELWADAKSGYDATLLIEYETASPPDAPVLTAPAHNTTVVPLRPTFDWNYSDPQGDAQNGAQVRILDATGVTTLFTWPVTGTATSLVAPVDLTRGTTYQWDVRTSDDGGTTYGNWSTRRTVTVKAFPVVTIDPARYMEMYNGIPRLRVKWSVTGGTQSRYRITAPGYDTLWVDGPAQNLRLTGLTLTQGTAVSITVLVETTDVLQDSDTRSFTPRWGTTVHRRDLTATPQNWGSPVVQSTVPTGASLVVEYGSAPSNVAAPTAWYASLSSVPKARYLFYRVWLIPSATEGPSLNKITIPADFAASGADHWFGTVGGGVLAPPWSIDSGEYVYGTRSLTKAGDGSTGFAYSERIKLRAGRSYILTGLMKSEGDSGALFNLYDVEEGAVVTQNGVNIQSDILRATRDWFEADRLDVYRYKTPVYVATGDMEVVVRLRVNGAVGTAGWFDGLKLEESTVATPWGPSAIGAVSVDAGGVQVDAQRGGVFRLRSSSGLVTDQSANGLVTEGEFILNSDLMYMRIQTNGAHALLIGGKNVTSNVPFRIGNDGRIDWGSGGAARDTALYRSGVNELKTPGMFDAYNIKLNGRLYWVTGRVEGFMAGPIAAGAASAAMGRWSTANTAPYISRPLSGRAGRALGIAWRSSAAVTANSITLRGARSGTNQTGADVVITSASGTTGWAPFATPFDFTALQNVSINVESAAGLTPTTITIAADVIVEWDAVP